MAEPKKPALTNDAKREWAQILFVKEGLSQKEIAAKVGASEKTVGTWKEKFGWDNLRKSLLVTKEEQLRRLYDQLDYLTTEIATRDRRVATPPEADTIGKLTAAIKQLETETSLAEIVDVGSKFLEFVRTQDIAAAKEIVSWFDAFIQNNLRK